MEFQKLFFAIIAVTLLSYSGITQTTSKKTVIGDSLYQSNIKKSRLYGVYIPKDIPDALQELEKLSTPEAKSTLQKANEATIGKKLRFGLGRWMEYNWNFQEGSRFSHLLREMGMSHVDDMVEFMIILFYRHVKNAPLMEKELADQMVKRRKEILKKEEDQNTIQILSEKKMNDD